MMRRTHSKAFTLVELLVVIAIVGGLGSIVVTQINEARKKAEYSKFYADIKGFYDAIHIYTTNKNNFPVHSDCQDSEYAHSMISNFNGTVEYSTVLLITNSPGWCVYQMPTSSTPTNNHVLSVLNTEGLFTKQIKVPYGTNVWYGVMTQSYISVFNETTKCGSQVINPGRSYLWGFVNASSSEYLPKERSRIAQVDGWTGSEYVTEDSFCFYVD